MADPKSAIKSRSMTVAPLSFTNMLELCEFSYHDVVPSNLGGLLGFGEEIPTHMQFETMLELS